MRVCHGFTATFDDPNLVSCAGLAPVLQLAERAGLQQLVADHVKLEKPGGRNAHLKVPSLVAGMVAGADSIDDMALLRHGAMPRLFRGVRAPSTLATAFGRWQPWTAGPLGGVASRLATRATKPGPVLASSGWRLAMTARRPVATTTLQLLAPPASTLPSARHVDTREVIDVTIRADSRLLLSVEEAAQRLGIGRSLMYELISSGQVASIRVGRLRRIAPEALSVYVARLHDGGRDGPDPAA